MQRLPVFAIGLVAGLTGFAIDAVWINTTDESADWNTPANWQGVPGGYPDGAEYDVTLTPMTEKYSQRLYLGDATWTSADYQLNSLSGSDVNHQLLLKLKPRKGQYAANPSPFHLSIANPNGFLGFIVPLLSHAWIDMVTTGSFVPVYPSVNAGKMLYVNVTNANTRGEIGELYGRGVLVKKGDGQLSVKSTSGAANQIRLEQGSLELGDALAESAEALLAGAWLHLDASVDSTFHTTVGEDGRLWVTNWADVRGNGLSASSSATAGFGAPYLSTAKSGTGLTLLDFGDISGFADSGAATNRCLILSEPVTTGREFFYVGQYVRRNLNSVFGWHNWQYYQFHAHATQLFSIGNADDAVSFGDIAFDGEKRRADFAPTEDMWSKMHVMSVGTLADVRCDALGTDRQQVQRTGGMRLGEVIIFTAPLTHRQRQTINRYLQKKWCVDFADCDVGAVTLAKGANEISVPNGTEAHVRRLYTEGQTLVKKGGGALRVDVFEPADAEVSVLGGSVVFSGGLKAVDETQPATNAYLWLDATADAFVMSNLTGNATNYVAQWRDCRADRMAVYARAPVPADGTAAFNGRLPYCRENAAGTLRAVNFGRGDGSGLTGGDSAWLRLNVSGENAYAGFVVFRMTTASKNQPIFGTTQSSAIFSRDWRSAFVHPNYAIGEQLGARWSLDGKTIDPTVYLKDGNGSVVGYTTNDFHVAAFSADSKFQIDAIGKERLDNGACGNIEVGEFILYDRRLSDDEIRATEAYLMKRWLKKDHPDNASKTVSPRLTFAADVPVVIDSDVSDEYAADAIGGNGVLVKRGIGTALVTGVSTGRFETVSVKVGTLSLAFTDETAGLLTPAWRFDADEKEKMQFLDGTSSVSNWFSAADCTYDMHAIAGPLVPNEKIQNRLPAFPTLVENAEIRPGVTGNYVDFGDYNSSDPAPEGSMAAAFAIDDLDHNGVNTCYDQCWLIREAYVIYSDRTGGTKRAPIFGTTSRNDYRYDFLRGGDGSLFSSSARSGVRNGYIALDGVQTNASAVLPDGFHLVSVQPVPDEDVVGTVKPGVNFRIDAMASDRNECGGGCRIAEIVAYKGQHTPRQRTFIEQSLMHKWFGAPAAKWTQAIGSVSVDAGAELMVANDDVALLVTDLSGSGTVTVGAIAGVSSLTVPGGRGGVSTLTVNGAVRFADNVTVTVDADGLVDTAGAPYAVMLAESLENADVQNWTIDVPCKATRRPKLVKSGNSILLDFDKTGLMMIFR